jgi:hypothetical protein
MEKQPIVPNQFFDIFARIVPGVVLIYARALLHGSNLLEGALEFFVPLRLQDQVIPWLGCGHHAGIHAGTSVVALGEGA